jgi:hypothetical protein
MGKGEPGERACSASAQRRLPVPAMTPFDTRSWNDLSTTAGTPGFLNSKAGEVLSTSPNTLQAFFLTHIAHAVGHRPHTAFMHPHRMDDRGSVNHLWATTGV